MTQLLNLIQYNTLVKHQLCTTEVNGLHFHKGNDAKQSRDELKNQIFTTLKLHLLRISTTDTVNQKTI